MLNKAQKYVVSSTLEEPLPWENSTLLAGLDAVAEVREQAEGDITVLGSGVLIRSLLAHGLIDEMLLMIHPLVLGKRAADARRRPAAPVGARRLGDLDHRRRDGDVPRDPRRASAVRTSRPTRAA